MKILMVLILSCLVLFSGSAFALEDARQHPACPHCGMDREKFAHSRMLVEYDDKTRVGTCSIHCMAVELAGKLDKTPVSMTVGDFETRKLIDAEKATWVIGGSKPGVMTKRSKWAFENRTDAERFVRSHGGVIASFDDAMKAAYEDMYADTKMIREKRKMRKMQMQGK